MPWRLHRPRDTCGPTLVVCTTSRPRAREFWAIILLCGPRLGESILIVGFNNLGFDYEVLHAYTVFDLRQLPTLDMLVELKKNLAHRLSLDAIAHATMGVAKTAEGLQAIRWFKEGKLTEIAEYCCYDVKITRLIHEYGTAHKQLFYTNKFGARLTVPVSW